MSPAQHVTADDSWRLRPAAQQPDWPASQALAVAVAELSSYPPLVFAGECDRLRERIAAVARGEAFVLQGGDCAETFDTVTADQVRAKVRTLLQMAAVLTYAGSVPVVKIGRIAGQYAKPRSTSTEVRGGAELPVYRGDAVNGAAFTPEARIADPERLKRMYHSSAATLNLIRAFTSGGYADLRQVHEWNRDFVAGSPFGERYEKLAQGIDDALSFLAACGADPAEFHSAEIFASHEALLLDYEAALTRTDARTGLPYDVSGHMIWIGERTRQLDGAHVEFASRIRNPIGVKLGPTATPDEALALLDKLDPEGEPGRITLITRMGAKNIRAVLPDLVTKVAAEGRQPAWICDPMHGNTFEAPSGHKTRRFDDILDEVRGFFEVHLGLGGHPGGIHIELTGDDVTECVGGGSAVRLCDLDQRYESACDPRLNRQQSLDLAFQVAELHRSRGTIPPRV
ncbi:class II 3-deoxy-7-phosphoheptulonate synthase [Streptomyces sp. NPDC052040]|uniref:class II 3-deoxy-7-phosphoheptulonate synthase n=1 Tax=unclassified Streptomyces TaxID=2593676 RepID=UPI0037D22704